MRAKPGTVQSREQELSARILDAAIEVHRTLGGPGLLESVYEEALVIELCDRGMAVQRQVRVPLIYKGRSLTTPLRVDVVVEDCVLVECKAVEKYNSISEAQALTYLRLTQLHLALVINFGEKLVTKGTHRVANGLR